MEHKFSYRWNLKDGYPAPGIEYHGSKVFSTFACGGGSTMGYKLAGYDVIGCEDIDPKMMEVYKVNHKPRFSFLEGIQTFKLRKDLPDELYQLDILDGSPPCSSFSMAGNREKDWGKEKKFREGQAEQVLDNLFFDYIDLAKELQPKAVLAENVKGLMLGEAKQYVRKIYTEFQNAGYELRIAPYLLDASKMGVPQRRERVFFIALRRDLSEPFMEQVDMFQFAPKLELSFKEPGITFSEIKDNTDIKYRRKPFNDNLKALWHECKPGNSFSTVHPKGSYFNTNKLSNSEILPTLATECYRMNYLEDIPYCMSSDEIILGGSFPLDYNFIKQKNNENGCNAVGYLIGMSVPPVMIAQISHQIYLQWLSKL